MVVSDRLARGVLLGYEEVPEHVLAVGFVLGVGRGEALCMQAQQLGGLQQEMKRFSISLHIQCLKYNPIQYNYYR